MHDKFHVDHAAAGVFNVAFQRRMGGEHFFAHGDDFTAQFGGIAVFGEDLAADVFKGFADGGAAADVAGAGECLVFPRPGAFALVFFEGFYGVNQIAGFAVGAQPQIDIIKRARAGAAGKPGGEAAGEFAVEVGRVGMRVVKQINQIQIGSVAQFFAAEFAVADDGERRGIGVFFRHIAPGVIEGEREDGVGQIRELVAQGFYFP